MSDRIYFLYCDELGEYIWSDDYYMFDKKCAENEAHERNNDEAECETGYVGSDRIQTSMKSRK